MDLTWAQHGQFCMYLLTSSVLEDDGCHKAEHENTCDDAAGPADCHLKQVVIAAGEHNCKQGQM